MNAVVPGDFGPSDGPASGRQSTSAAQAFCTLLASATTLHEKVVVLTMMALDPDMSALVVQALRGIDELFASDLARETAAAAKSSSCL